MGEPLGSEALVAVVAGDVLVAIDEVVGSQVADVLHRAKVMRALAVDRVAALVEIVVAELLEILHADDGVKRVPAVHVDAVVAGAVEVVDRGEHRDDDQRARDHAVGPGHELRLGQALVELGRDHLQHGPSRTAGLDRELAPPQASPQQREQEHPDHEQGDVELVLVRGLGVGVLAEQAIEGVGLLGGEPKQQSKQAVHGRTVP